MRSLWEISIILVMILSACGGLAGEPEIVATMPVSQSAAHTQTPDVLPDTMPNLEMGAVVYQTNCVRCHGESARGDGELVLNGQIPPLMDFNSGERQAQSSPVEWFDIVTNGRLETLMPPWSGSLSNTERWAVTMYLYSLAYSPQQISAGETIYQASCAECHGENATGTSEAPAIAGIFERSDSAAAQLIANGTANMPAFIDFSAEEITNVIAYLRTVGSGTLSSDSGAEIDEAIEPTLGTISGTVINGSMDGVIPQNMVVQLHVVDRSFNEQIIETRLNSDGTFRFDDILIDPNHGFVATIFYQGSYFTSDFIPGDFGMTQIDLPITLYEPTNDPSVLRIEEITAQIFADAESLQVVEIITLTNMSDHVFIGEEAISSPDRITLQFPLPEQATYLDIGDERYRISDDGQFVMDTQAVLPDKPHIVHLGYTLPYDGSVILNQQMPYPFAGMINVLIGTDGVVIQSNQLQPLG
ncbi:MAG: hypothetical protein D6711_11970, partial [Chloroflexi bacterium]